jgi:hypothetical protein
MKYTVFVFSQNAWNTDGTPIVDRDCGHQHQSIKTAAKCLDRLKHAGTENGETNATWFRACIQHSDTTALTDEESEETVDFSTYNLE